MLTKAYLDKLTREVIGAAIEVHREMGPGLLEKIYHKCMERELDLRGIKYTSEQTVPINYKGEVLESDLRADLLVEGCLMVELKAVIEMKPIFETQILSYMKLTKKPKGILINFTVTNIFKEGQKTFVNELYRALPNE
jgi:GxxExxY protein